MPDTFLSFRMYDSGGQSGRRQACTATIRTPQGDVNEVVVLERGSGMVFDVAATRDGSDWTITSEGTAPTDENSPVFRYLLVDCVSALEDKYRAEPYGYRSRQSPLHR
ncbi:hypothetical protein C7408_12119 [Paraburkholderia caballeronis]|uniref:Uncharacterized protein n=2 Tax=Paraburkholderia caballeronis TaxID=416943 RepID=A0A1H7TK45_9BURK|nr:hypothetical protein C7403_116102 [Paraburkholderia caballeronis]PXW95699.1 hypothetical protein C7407_116102 [Paraburkholderia caballeronis]RAJ92045.1 hypothetical protein C7409_116102 [Paraburkholderia caballeronis]TDV06925.1 hypothetical protein C7408_12119 [Paraburkholderia caballeronis]TDV10904.1 hypothetical protein C7406_12319 [Paraburkholderia caballeronis]